MRHILPRALVAVLTFFVGLAGVQLLSHGARPESEGTPASEPPAVIVTLVKAPEPPRFKRSLRGCGMGYFQLYEMPDGQKMSEGAACSETASEAKREWRKLLATATKVVERVPLHKNRLGEWGERVVAFFPPDEYSGDTAQILWYGGGRCYLYISAPTLDIALEFEKSDAYAH
ncbi:MAG TPA: hypothetical protein VGX48_23150 [Pyrinomonadaceae bacterium]|jgi:hypothetical protein|nr:hypothetical protein [Pyrinomonadaceae bacterium]